jgi:hypothetical protein
MNIYHITEIEPCGFSTTWQLEAKDLTSAKRQATRSQGYINTDLLIEMEYGEYNTLIPMSRKGPIERASKWEDYE